MSFNYVDPDAGFTSDVIKDPKRFVGRSDLIKRCIRALNSEVGLLALYGKRGVGKSSLLRQIQQMALGDYSLAKEAGLEEEIPARPRKYLTVHYSCDALIKTGFDLINRLCNDQDDEDGLLRLVPNDGKEIVEFSRVKEASIGADLKVVNWGAKGIESSKYAKTVEGDSIQTFRNYVRSAIQHQVKNRMNRDGLLILLDEFDVIENKDGIGSLIKSLSSSSIKFGVCGIGTDLADLVEDHGSVERLLEQGAIHVKAMDATESREILNRAEELCFGRLSFSKEAKDKITEISRGFPYFVQMVGKDCVAKRNSLKKEQVDEYIFKEVLLNIKNGTAFPTLEGAYQRAIGSSPDRQILLHLLAEQPEAESLLAEDVGRVYLKNIRKEAGDFDVEYIDQLLPRLIDRKFGPALSRVPEGQGVYEFNNPVFRLYVNLRNF